MVDSHRSLQGTLLFGITAILLNVCKCHFEEGPNGFTSNPFFANVFQKATFFAITGFAFSALGLMYAHNQEKNVANLKR